MPCLFLPNYCPCHRLLLGDDYDKTIIEEVEKTQWTYNEEAMQHTKQRATCIICLEKLKNGDLCFILPCGQGQQAKMSNAGSSYGMSMASDF